MKAIIIHYIQNLNLNVVLFLKIKIIKKLVRIAGNISKNV